MRRKSILLIAVALIALLASAAAHATPAEGAPAAQPGDTLSGFEDSGEFTLYLDGEPLATSSFTWSRDGHISATSVISTGRLSATFHIEVTPDESGRWKTISMEAPTGRADAARNGALVTMSAFGEKVTCRVDESAYLLESLNPALLSLAVAGYERAGGGKQSMPIFVFPHRSYELTMEKTGTAKETLGGVAQEFTLYTMSLDGEQFTAWVGPGRKVVMLDIPSQYCTIIRKGYEELSRRQADPLVSAPTCTFRIREEVRVPMRDGARAAVDLYLPDLAGKAPAILIRTPYAKEIFEPEGKFWARRGYVVAIADVRGRFASEGVFEPFVHEGHDGYDTVEWLASTPWCNGRVGMLGAGYGGAVQWLAAVEAPAHLVTIAPDVAMAPPRYQLPYENGAFSLLAASRWMSLIESRATTDLTGAALFALQRKDYSRLLSGLPVIDLDKAVVGAEKPYWRAWILRQDDESYWSRTDFLSAMAKVKIPVFLQSGWFDPNGRGTELAYLRLGEAGRRHAKMILGPWEADLAARRHGERDFGPSSVVDLTHERLRWFDYWLKGFPTGVERDPRVRLFVMGENRWREGDCYPLEGTEYRRLYLESAGAANSSRGDGRLSWARERSGAELDRYDYDPLHPTADPDFYPTVSPEKRTEGGSMEEESAKRKKYHGEVTDSARDLLCYVTEPLATPLTVCGPVRTTLFASSSARDTDWYVSLMEVDEKGEIFPLVSGAVRARCRTSLRPEPLSPGVVERYEIDLAHTAITVPAGHRLRVEVASAKFPTFSRNLNTGRSSEQSSEGEVAHQRIYHSAAYPSCLHLPILSAP